MKKKFLLVLTLSVSLLTSSCIGSFTLSNRMLNWNRNLENKFLNELVFFAFWVLPVYEVCGLADLLVLNSIEFWGGVNPMASETSYVVTGTNGEKYSITRDEKGYTITGQEDKSNVRLEFNPEESEWSYDINSGEYTGVLFAYIDNSHVRLPLQDGTFTTVEISADGLFAYRQLTSAPVFAAVSHPISLTKE